ncbi:MAG: cellulase family glycosylhydrolase [Natronospirillum sp.]
MKQEERMLETGQWSERRAREWHGENDWSCGFNYLPRTAVNFLDMWMPDSFDIDLIRQELTWAQQAGYNAIRTNLPYVVWLNDRDGLLTRIDSFLGLADELGFSVMLCPLDDCEFSGMEPVFGTQPAPEPLVHNSRAVGSPGRDRVVTETEHPSILRYVKDIISTFANDTRVNIWDLYNEPGNTGTFSGGTFSEYSGPLYRHALSLMKQVFKVARECNPIQPLTVGCWRMGQTSAEGDRFFTDNIDQTALALSDVVSFHAYCDKATLERIIKQLKSDYDRPLFCTEWMARHVDSRIETQLQVFKSEGVGCYQWGLVAGETQTYLPWPNINKPELDLGRETKLWFHDIFWSDGRPYDQGEIDTVRALTGSSRS